MSELVPITIPMTIESTETTVQMDMQDVVAPVQIDFTASAVTLPSGSDATVEYAQKHFTFGIPKGESGGGGGAVDSVNGMTGDVVLTASDVNALPDSTVIPTKVSDLTNDSGFVNASGAASASPVQSVNGKTGTVVLNASDVGAGTYSKPSGGIPKTDLASGVQTSLGKADTALQTAPVTSVNGNTGAVVLSIPSTASDVGAEPAITEVTITSTGAVTQALDAGKIYHFTGSLTSLTITLNAATGQIPQYHFDFISGSTAVTLTMPNTVVMPDSFAVEANKRYEVDVLNNYGAVMTWATS